MVAAGYVHPGTSHEPSSVASGFWLAAFGSEQSPISSSSQTPSPSASVQRDVARQSGSLRVLTECCRSGEQSGAFWPAQRTEDVVVEVGGCDINTPGRAGQAFDFSRCKRFDGEPEAQGIAQFSGASLETTKYAQEPSSSVAAKSYSHASESMPHPSIDARGENQRHAELIVTRIHGPIGRRLGRSPRQKQQKNAGEEDGPLHGH